LCLLHNIDRGRFSPTYCFPTPRTTKPFSCWFLAPQAPSIAHLKELFEGYLLVLLVSFYNETIRRRDDRQPKPPRSRISDLDTTSALATCWSNQLAPNNFQKIENFFLYLPISFLKSWADPPRQNSCPSQDRTWKPSSPHSSLWVLH